MASKMSKCSSKPKYIDSLDHQHRERYIQKIKDVSGIDPYQVEPKKLSANDEQLPDITFGDIIMYLVNGTSAYTLEQFKAYKSLEAYNYVVSGWVDSVNTYKPEGCANIIVIAKVLEEKRAELCKNLTAIEHFPYLRSKYILTLEDEEVIKQELTSKQKNSKFLDLLIKRGPKAFDELVKSILEIKTQVFLAEMLNKTYEEKRRMLQAVIEKDSHKCATSNKTLSKSEPFPQSTHPVHDPVKYNMASIQLNVDTLSLPTPEKKQNIVCHNSEGIEHSELVGRRPQKQKSDA